jgi:hypothetical protein
VSPDRRSDNPYDGPERRTRVRRSSDLPPIRHGWFTTWQWAVIAVLLIAVVGSVFVGRIAESAINNTHRIDRALCIQIAYLERQAAVATSPAAHDNLINFAASLRPLVPSCPPPPKGLR